MISLEKLSEKVEKNRAVRDGENAIVVIGPTVKMQCTFTCCEKDFEIPTNIFDENGRVRDEYWRVRTLSGAYVYDTREFENGAFMCKNGLRKEGASFYSSSRCWADHCAD